ncbi:MAG: AAA family ATPase [Lactobacillales bacterium]|nr:AAA family ATPase [Lactobacillales bacterium]
MKRDLKEETVYLKDTYEELLSVKKKAEEILQEHHEEGTKLMSTMGQGFNRDVSTYTSQLETFSEIEIKNREIDQLNAKHDSWKNRLDMVNRLLKEPYFGRIDVLFEGEKETEKFYLGVNSFRTLKDEDRIIDWRAPIAELYYNREIGATSYEVNHQEIAVNLTLRRQFTLEEDRLINYYDTSIAILDELLLQALSENSSEYMQDITATIQKEQNEIIRDTTSRVLLVNGIAGSGKTSAVLQRIAYLLYQCQQSLSSKDVLLFAPNPVFINYISKVLPNLGEKNPTNLTIRQLVRVCLSRRVKLEDPFKYLERNIQQETTNQTNVLRSVEFFKFLSNKSKNTVFQQVNFRSIQLKEEEIFSTEEIFNLYENVPKTQTADKQLQALAAILEEELDRRLQEKARTKEWYDKITQMTEEEQEQYFGALIQQDSKGKIAKLAYYYLKKAYQKVFQQISRYNWLSTNILFQKFYNEYSGEKLFLHEELTVDEGVCLLVIQHFFVKHLTQRNVRFVLIDEVQDYSSMQLRLLIEMYPRANFTLLGDENQAIFQTSVDFSTVREIFEKLNFLVTQKNLATSYRSSAAITQLFQKMANNKEEIHVVSVQDEGEVPEFLEAQTAQEYNEKIIKVLKNLPKNQSTAVITKDILQAEYLEEIFKEEVKFKSFIHSKMSVPASGIYLLPISVAKGLEFDNVILHDVSKKNFVSDKDRHLLYTGISRSMKKLFLPYLGQRSCFFEEQ